MKPVVLSLFLRIGAFLRIQGYSQTAYEVGREDII
jgi:hypothetical protein